MENNIFMAAVADCCSIIIPPIPPGSGGYNFQKIEGLFFKNYTPHTPRPKINDL